VIVHEDHSVPVVAVNTWYHVGSADERPGRTGFAHLFEHIMFKGSQHVPTGDGGPDGRDAGGVREFFRTYFTPNNAHDEGVRGGRRGPGTRSSGCGGSSTRNSHGSR
jgi:zinc protease